MEHQRGAKIDAVLHNVHVQRREGGTVLFGNIEADSRNKLKDGKWVQTSPMVALYGNIAKTKSGTVYYVASWGRKPEAMS